MNDMHLIAIEAEARRYCDEKGIRDHDTFQHIAAGMRHSAFMRSIEPYIKQKVHILSLRQLDHIVMREGQPAEHIYKPDSPEVASALASLDELIAYEAKRWGFDPTPERTGAEPHEL